MWILESDGEFLQGTTPSSQPRIRLPTNIGDTGKYLWLRPGQRYLFGRVKKDGVFQAIDHKAVSRRHCVVEVDKVEPGHGALLHSRSKVTVTDEKSKSGTLVDGRLLKGTSQELKNTEHHLKLGAYPHYLTIKWRPVCLSFFLTSKERKDVDALGPKRALLEPLDIKTVQPFVHNQTTHVVAAKRNTVPGLQALITGKYIVDNSYIDALIFAATPEDLEGDENLSPLEKDFDSAWPDPRQYLPPKGREPTSRLSEAYAPEIARQSVFEGWTFVFLDPGQYESILPAITTGHGKALLYRLEVGRTTADDIVTYMRNAAGDKGFGTFDASTDEGGVIMVKPTLKGEMSKWGDELANEVALKVDQKYIDQADFLDAILANDAAPLRKAVPFETNTGDVDASAMPDQPARIEPPPSQPLPQRTQAASVQDVNRLNEGQSTQQPTVNIVNEQEVHPRKRPRTRAAVVSRFKAFDDEFDMDAIAPHEHPEGSIKSQTLPSQENGATPSSMEEQLSQNNESRAQKRGRSPSEDAMVEGLLPAATAMKKRKLEIDRQRGKSGVAAEHNPDKGLNAPATRRAKPKKEMDVRKVASERREAEEAARRDQEALETNLDEISVEEMKNLAVVVEMEVPTRTERAARVDGIGSNRWNEQWNGRKNFKRFRRKGEGADVPRRQTQNVIVPLVEVKRKNYGIGESYWSSSHDKENGSGQSAHRSRAISSQTQTQSQSQLLEEDSTLPTLTRLQQEAAEIVAAIDVDRPRQTRQADKTQQSQATTKGGRGKRPASSTATGPAKKQRTIRTRAGSDSESDEELRFKFGGRKR